MTNKRDRSSVKHPHETIRNCVLDNGGNYGGQNFFEPLKRHAKKEVRAEEKGVIYEGPDLIRS